jgi:hypothetical protein
VNFTTSLRSSPVKSASSPVNFTDFPRFLAIINNVQCQKWPPNRGETGVACTLQQVGRSGVIRVLEGEGHVGHGSV